MIVKPHLSEASLHFINTSKLTPHNIENVSFPRSYEICEDTLVSFCRSFDNRKCGVYTATSPSGTGLPDIANPYAQHPVLVDLCICRIAIVDLI